MRPVEQVGQALLGAGVCACWRPALGRRLRRAWALASLLAATGAGLAIYAARVEAPGPGLALSLLLLALGLGVALWGSLPALADETCLVARRDALCWWPHRAAPVEIPWARIDAVEVLPGGGGLRLRLDAPAATVVDVPVRFEGVSAAALADELWGLRRRALMGLPLR